MTTDVELPQLAQILQQLGKKTSHKPESSLTQTRTFLAKLAWPLPQAIHIVVAGTNGKGTAVQLLSNALLKAGLRVASFTSPHIYRFNERITVNGKAVAESQILTAFNEIQQKLTLLPDSYFISVLLAAWYCFLQTPLDVIIWEVGIGGRYDAVNVIDADIAVITNIDWDHMDILGQSLAEIAYQKAGIMRAGQPVVIAQADPPEKIIEQAQLVGADLYQPPFFQANQQAQIELALPDAIPAEIALACAQVLRLQPFNLSWEQICRAFAQTYLPARQQYCNIQNRRICIDMAHNPHASAFLAQNISKKDINGRVLAVVAMYQDKQIAATLANMVPIVAHWFVAALDSPRSASVVQIEQTLDKLHVVHYQSANSLKSAFAQALENSQEEDFIVVFGSSCCALPIFQYNKEFKKL